MAAAVTIDRFAPHILAEAKSSLACASMAYETIRVVPGQSVKVSLMPWQVAAHRRVLRFLFGPHEQPKRIAETCAHVGCDLRLLANAFPAATITSFENNRAAFECLQANSKALSKVTLVYGDCTDSKSGLSTIPPVDLVYLDPPWPAKYSACASVGLALSGISLFDIVTKWLALCPNILVKVPRNFDFNSIKGLPLAKRWDIADNSNGHVFYLLLYFRAKSS